MSILTNKALVKRIFTNLAKDGLLMITGQSGSGKGTLVKGLQRIAPPGSMICKVSTGDEFRTNIPTFSSLVRDRLQEINDTGQLQSPAIAASLVVLKIMREWQKNSLLIIEGSPRSVKEVEYLHNFICGFLKRRIILFNLFVDDELAAKRLAGRNAAERTAGGAVRKETDDPQATATKIAFYHEHVAPAVAHMGRYSQTEAVVLQIDIDEHMTPDEVLVQVIGRMPVGDTVSA